MQTFEIKMRILQKKLNKFKPTLDKKLSASSSSSAYIGVQEHDLHYLSSSLVSWLLVPCLPTNKKISINSNPDELSFRSVSSTPFGPGLVLF